MDTRLIADPAIQSCTLQFDGATDVPFV